MSWFTRTAEAEPVVAHAPVVPAMRAVERTLSDTELAEYVETARSIGVVNGSLKAEMVRSVLAEMGLRVYNEPEVERYLDQVFGKAKSYAPTWGWRALRTQDGEGIRRTGRNPWDNGAVLSAPYSSPIPLPVLQTIKRLSEAVEGLHFFVSDRVTPDDRADPFLAVTAPGMSLLIVERWDEPNFRG